MKRFMFVPLIVGLALFGAVAADETLSVVRLPADPPAPTTSTDGLVVNLTLATPPAPEGKSPGPAVLKITLVTYAEGKTASYEASNGAKIVWDDAELKAGALLDRWTDTRTAPPRPVGVQVGESAGRAVSFKFRSLAPPEPEPGPTPQPGPTPPGPDPSPEPSPNDQNLKMPSQVLVRPNYPGDVSVTNPGKIPILINNPASAHVRFKRMYSDDPSVLNYEVWADATGEYYIQLVVNSSAPKTKPPVVAGVIRIVCQNPGPGPGPDPGPGPGPTPTPGTSPFPDPGLQSLIIYEKDDLGTSKMPFPLTDPGLETALEKCVAGPGKKPNGQPIREYRVFDQNADVSKAAPKWRNAMAKFQAAKAAGKAAVPWIMVGNGKAGEEKSLSGMTVADVDALLTRYQQQ